MGFEGLLGNQRLKDNLTASVGRGRISHFYLISGPKGSGKHTLARLLSAAILCRDEHKPCLSCTACRKVLSDNHPDLITVTDPDHKAVPVKMVREIRDDMFIRPNEADRKIYIFPQELGDEGQNALLKILEEPPSYGVYILLSENPEQLLQTVRSRSTELPLQALPENILRQQLQAKFPDAQPDTLSAALARCGGYLGQAMELMEEGGAMSPQTERFVESFAHRDALGLVQVLAPMEKWKRDQFLPELQQWNALLESALVCRSGMPALSPLARTLAENRSSSELVSAIRCLQKCMEYTQGNVSVAAVCGYLEWALR